MIYWPDQSSQQWPVHRGGEDIIGAFPPHTYPTQACDKSINCHRSAWQYFALVFARNSHSRALSKEHISLKYFHERLKALQSSVFGSLSTLESLCKVDKSNKCWWTVAEYYRLVSLKAGTVSLSPAWFEQGHEVSCPWGDRVSKVRNTLNNGTGGDIFFRGMLVEGNKSLSIISQWYMWSFKYFKWFRPRPK